MKTKRKATRLPSSLPELTTQTPTPKANRVNPSLETHITCSLVTTKTVEPHSSTKKAGFDDVIVLRRSQRIRSAVTHHPIIRDADSDVQLIDTTGSEQDELGSPAQRFPDQELNRAQIEDITPESQNQHPAGSEKGSQDNSVELEPEETMNDKPKGSKNKSEMQYRTMYLESQKKLQKLTGARNELSKKLALEVCEKGSGILSSIISIASAFSNTSDQAFACTTPSAKPKKDNKHCITEK